VSGHVAEADRHEARADRKPQRVKRIGHKGADTIRPGNTLESFQAAVEIGVDMIEFDVLALRDSGVDGAPDAPSPLVVAHDWAEVAEREPLTLTAALDAFTRPPLVGVELDLDLKLPGREDELVECVRAAGLVDRTMVSTMYVESLDEIARLEPGIQRGLTFPRVTRDWRGMRWARPLVALRLATMRRQLPRIALSKIGAHGLHAMWIYEALITAPVVHAVHQGGTQVIAWTVDEAERIQSLRELGVDGICSNDPRLLQAA